MDPSEPSRSVVVTSYAHAGKVGDHLAKLPREVTDALYARLEAYVGRSFPLGPHVEHLRVEDKRVRANLFLDVDGTLWIHVVAAE